jgi:hypothetical protein
MKKFSIVLITAAICLPLGAFAKDFVLKGHPHLKAAHRALHTAFDEIQASQKSNEGIWKDEGGHGAKAKEDIEKAMHQIDEAAEWVDTHK